MNEKKIADQKRTIQYLKNKNNNEKAQALSMLEIRNMQSGPKCKKRVSTI